MRKKPLKISDDEIMAAMSRKGGWTRATLSKWGVPWPPPKGWRKALVSGTAMPTENVGRAPSTKPNWTIGCEVCGQTPTVGGLGLCGPCCFGEAESIGGNW